MLGLTKILGAIFGEAAPQSKDFAVPYQFLADIVSEMPFGGDPDVTRGETALRWSALAKLVYNADHQSPVISKESGQALSVAFSEIAEAIDGQAPNPVILLKLDTIGPVAHFFPLLDDLRAAYSNDTDKVAYLYPSPFYYSSSADDTAKPEILRDAAAHAYQNLAGFFKEHPEIGPDYAKQKATKQFEQEYRLFGNGALPVLDHDRLF